MSLKMLQGDCIEKMKEIPDNSIDSIVTDPPYELGFMGKQWDSTGIAFNIIVWEEALRILKPGGHLLAFGATRTYHRLACAIEDAGFEIRDMLQWIYGSGFPKSMDVSKAIDKKLGKTREVIGVDAKRTPASITAPASDEAKQWSGWGTALKPANEPIVLARKPLSEKTVVDNILHWGTGGINIDDSRIPSNEMPKACQGTGWASMMKTNLEQGYRPKDYYQNQSGFEYTPKEQGRFPTNILLDEETAALLNEQSGECKAGSSNGNARVGEPSNGSIPPIRRGRLIPRHDSGGAARFFYCAKASKRERGIGNTHPTVKPVKLMEYLVALVTPPLGIVLDPFAGSGTTGIACAHKGFNFLGIELDAHNWEICVNRLRRCK